MKQLYFIALLLVGMTAGAQTDSLRIDSLLRTLPEVMIMGERPMVKAERGKLVFDLPRLMRDKGVDNAYDALKELPGVTEQGNSLQLAGRPVTIIIDGKVSTMTPEQLTQLLRTIPATRIKDAEVMYAAPAHYQVRGQVINLNLSRDTAHDVLQGQVSVGAMHEHDARFKQQASFFAQRGRWSIDGMYGHHHGRSYSESHDQSLHLQSDGTVYDIRSHTIVPRRLHEHNYRLEVDYASMLSLAYTGSHNTRHNTSTTEGDIISQAGSDDRTTMHNLQLNYKSSFGLKAVADYTWFHARGTSAVNSVLPSGPLCYDAESSQRINRLKVFASMRHEWAGEWGLNYGASYSRASDHSFQHINLAGMNAEAHQHESIVNIYGGFSKGWGKRFSLDITLAAELFKNNAFSEWAWFPTFNCSFMPSEHHLLQLSMFSDRRYPDYWAVASGHSFTDGGYGEVFGNPALRPLKRYQTQLVYLLKGKYQFSLWFEHLSDYFIQTAYQRQDRLVMEYRYVNFDFRQTVGLMAYAPWQITNWWQTNTSLYLLWNREKDSDFYDLPFDRSVFNAMLNWRNRFTITSWLTANVTFYARTRANQGLFNLPASANLTVDLVGQFFNKRLTVKVTADDLLRKSSISPVMRYKTQNYKMGFIDYRYFGITATYNIGGYKERQHQRVDTSRFKN